MMRWELLSAIMMFMASSMNVLCRKSSRNVMAFVFSGVGVGMACWFVTGLLGISLTAELGHHVWENIKQGVLYMLAHTPPDSPYP